MSGVLLFQPGPGCAFAPAHLTCLALRATFPACFPVACISLKTEKELFPSFMSSSRELDAHLSESNQEFVSTASSQVCLEEALCLRIDSGEILPLL